EREEPWLDAVVWRALARPRRLVGGGHEAGAGGGQLGSSLGVRDGGGDELREVGDARLRIRRERLRLFRIDRHTAPRTTFDHDRGADRRGDPEAAPNS